MNKLIIFILSLAALALAVVGIYLAQSGDMGMFPLTSGASYMCGSPGAAACDAPASAPGGMQTEAWIGWSLTGLGLLLACVAWVLSLVETARDRQWEGFINLLIVPPLIGGVAAIIVAWLFSMPFVPSIALAFVPIPTLVYALMGLTRGHAKARRSTSEAAPEVGLPAPQR